MVTYTLKEQLVIFNLKVTYSTYYVQYVADRQPNVIRKNSRPLCKDGKTTRQLPQKSNRSYVF